MLNKRQNNIIDLLKNTHRPIPARELASKYGVSLRTIRYDINKIDEIMSDEMVLVKLPGVGIKLSIMENTIHNSNRKLSDFIKFDSKTREYLLVYVFSVSEQFLTSYQLAELFDVSKSTIMNEIKMVNFSLANYQLKIVGRRKQGFEFVGTEKSIFNYFIKHIDHMQSEEVFKIISSIEVINHLEIKSLVKKDLITKIENEIQSIVTNSEAFTFLFNLLLNRNSILYAEHAKETLQSFNSVDIIERALQTRLHSQLHPMFIYVLNRYTDYLVMGVGGKLDEHAVEMFIKEVGSYYPEIFLEMNQLRNDLVVHLRQTLNNIEMEIKENNPILSQIKVQYYEVFNRVRNASLIINKAHDIELTEDEIGYLTLYFVRSIDKHNEIIESNVLIICNTGRGAAKLLSSRIINNIPEIHVLGIGNPASIENSMTNHSEIHLVISTIPLPSHIPHIVVSPLLNNDDLQDIRNTLYDVRSSSIVQNKVNRKAGNGDVANSTLDVNSQLMAEVVLETVQLYEQLKVHEQSLGKLAGILTHVVMSVPRWIRGDFISVGDYREMNDLYPYQMELIKQYILKVEIILKVTIPFEETIAVLRYIML